MCSCGVREESRLELVWGQYPRSRDGNTRLDPYLHGQEFGNSCCPAGDKRLESLYRNHPLISITPNKEIYKIVYVY